jgi:hypothetical protein
MMRIYVGTVGTPAQISEKRLDQGGIEWGSANPL